MNQQGILLDADIRDLEHHLTVAENSIRGCPSTSTNEQAAVLSRMEVAARTSKEAPSEFEMFQTMLEEQISEIKKLKDKIASMEETKANERQNDYGEVLVNMAAEGIRRSFSDERIRVEQEEDNDYWCRMVQKVSGPEVPALVSESSSDDEEERIMKSRRVEPEERNRVDELEYEIRQIEHDFASFPYRKKEEFSPGIQPDIKCAFCGIAEEHFSDSCPRIQNGDTRYDIIRGRELCINCLEDCPSSRTCKYRDRQCWYCCRVRGTAFHDFIPNDNGHHRALCNIPDKRDAAMRRTEAAKRELTEWQRNSPYYERNSDSRSKRNNDSQ
ncbi:hypothetical protein ANCDUO_05877 [Ancylostoma duodenale]|uniref:Uncharacterized protein n=1 Tax=Ancylostoma duodenale TaxID=51022 RepID=A0A0C2GXN2_9BILA|nr:hypothetical protein ANCDUO_05877 [Ancylostoma duodenale]